MVPCIGGPNPHPIATGKSGDGEKTPGDIVAERIKQRAKLLSIHNDHLLECYVLERAVYRLNEAFGASMMLEGSLVAFVADPAHAL